MNISIAIADPDMEYAERLSEALQQYAELTVHLYSSSVKLQKAMETKQFDIVLFDPDISKKKLDFPTVKYAVCLYSDEARNKGLYADCAKVAKYQRISSIYKEVVREYADKAGYSADLNRSQRAGTLAVYSPAGGSGKTTVALAVASRLAASGMNVLYIGTEQLGSSSCVNPAQEEGITALVACAADEKVSFKMKLTGIMKQGMNGISYVEGFERLVDYDAVSGEEMANVIDKIRRCGLCDVLIIDMESHLDGIGKAVLEAADRIILVEKPGELPAVKMKLFMQQAVINEHKGKLVKVSNFAENRSEYAGCEDIPAAGLVHNYGNLPLKNMIQAINSNSEIAVDSILNR